MSYQYKASIPEGMDSIPLSAAISDLSQLKDNLKASDLGFAESLLNFHKVRGHLTQGQIPYIYKLLQKALLPAEVPIADQPKATVGDVKGIVALFDKAKQKLKVPAISLNFDGHVLRLWIQGEKAKYPGAIGLLLDKVWIGRIHQDGIFQHSGAYNASPVKDQVLALLKKLSENPSETAAELGKLASRCCLCNLPLSDEKSLAMGYGATCAKNWGLVWGKQKFGMAQVVTQ